MITEAMVEAAAKAFGNYMREYAGELSDGDERAPVGQRVSVWDHIWGTLTTIQLENSGWTVARNVPCNPTHWRPLPAPPLNDGATP